MIDSSSPPGPAQGAGLESELCPSTPDPCVLTTLISPDRLSPDSSLDRLIGTRIGPYRIAQKIGEGGMGTVYRAERADNEFQIDVAIKVIRGGMDSQLLLERFRTERQILARLEHPYIGRLLDGGTTDDGLAYFLMEFINGQPLTRYCDARRLSVSERLALFQKVCDAVSHAHQQLVVHRDLKPDNILVTAEGVPKLLDFGIAKLLEDAIPGEPNERTRTMLHMGTPAYASPEQISGGPVGIPSDVYSLGVVLYELLTGQRPYRIESLGWAESARIICERDATRPSSLIARNAADNSQTQEVSRRRKTTVEGLRKRLTGDLDNILAVTLRKDPSRRYRSVDQLHEELQNHLHGRPVKARGDSILYKSGKLIGRHKLATAGLTLFTVLFCGAGSFAAWQAHRLSARLAEDRQLASSFLVEIHDQIAMLPGSTPAREALLVKSVDYLNGLARDVPDDLQLRRSLALAYERFADLLVGVNGAGLGRSAEALNTYAASKTLREALAREFPADATAQSQLASNYLLGSYITGRLATVAERRTYDEKAVAISQALAQSHPKDPQYQALLAKAYTSAAYGYGMAGKWAQANTYFRDAASIRQQLYLAHPNDPEAQRELANIEYRIGVIAAQAGQPRDALPHLKEALRLQDHLAASQKDDQRLRSDSAATHHFIGMSLAATNDFPRALAHFDLAIQLHEAMLAADPRDARTRSLLAGNFAEQSSALLQSGRKDLALSSIRRALALQHELLTLDPHGVPVRISLADYESRLAAVEAALGQSQPAARDWQSAADLYDQLDHEGHLGLPELHDDAARARREAARFRTSTVTRNY